MANSGKLEKIQILAYTDPKRTGKGEKLEFSVNPTQVSTWHENQYTRLRGINTSGRSAPYARSYSDQLSLQLIVDETIKSESGFLSKKQLTVADQIDRFLKFCAYMDGKIHEPRFLQVKWGRIDFECRLQSVEVKYTRFDEKGKPLRAELDTLFIADMPDDKRIRLENKQSPDITHNRIVRHGDTLPGLCKEVYGSSEYYLLVAEANQLDHFRRLKPGDDIYFPPIVQ